ncbi:ETEC_3214 domain-containing protein [Sulfurospirillum barnesii]|uniref:Uncharacterized protein n=1 Tax=Sulfurospirillum barnesii (strain ATCC 700032 / DSM 10660 / SES-3) TaxID=760154 RepID=I3XXU7_SULBS|nr:ETEC_3214 domain-containing protein [Sulfurospirillum barnesii]AFL68771.1 hypothetical protein Sulba_1483 [Sulfurospirillum barnesii SES-3]
MKNLVAFATIIGTIITFFAYFKPTEASINQVQRSNQSHIIQGNNNTILNYQNNITNDKNSSLNPENLLETLHLGVSKSYLISLFGTPRFDEKPNNYKINNVIFVFPTFFLQAIFSLEDKLIFYSITTRSLKFHPNIPKIDQKLLEITFSNLFDNAIYFYSELNPHYFSYAEKIYLGNSGNYKDLYLGYCPAGKSYDMSVLTISDENNPKILQEFRINNMPNCFGIGENDSELTRYLHDYQLNIHYYDKREIE